MRSDDNGSNWARWSAALDERDRLIARITSVEMKGLLDVIERTEAVAMELLDDDLVLDEAARRRIARLLRDIRRVRPSPE